MRVVYIGSRILYRYHVDRMLRTRWDGSLHCGAAPSPTLLPLSKGKYSYMYMYSKERARVEKERSEA